MKRFQITGLSHRTAPVEVREQFAVGAETLPRVLGELHGLVPDGGVIVTSTCNRLEIYTTTDDLARTSAALRRWLSSAGRVIDIEQYLYEYTDEAAVRHLFRVASSLDSMVVGEAQILGQIKAAYAAAQSAGTLDGPLDKCLARALKVARQVRRETGIAKRAVSVPQVSVELARKIFGHLADKQVLIVGAGKMSEMTARSLKTHGCAAAHVANRSPERAQKVAERLHGQAHALTELPQLLTHVDIAISSTDARDYVVPCDMVKAALSARRYKPLLVIDIAVPRDVDPRVGQLDNVYLFDIDDLHKVADSNLGERQREAQAGERMVEEQAHHFIRTLNDDGVTTTIVSLREKLARIKEEETERALRGLDLDPRVRERVERLANSLVNRILHGPTVGLKRLAAAEQGQDAVELVRSLFDLEEGLEEDMEEKGP